MQRMKINVRKWLSIAWLAIVAVALLVAFGAWVWWAGWTAVGMLVGSATFVMTTAILWHIAPTCDDEPMIAIGVAIGLTTGVAIGHGYESRIVLLTVWATIGAVGLTILAVQTLREARDGTGV